MNVGHHDEAGKINLERRRLLPEAKVGVNKMHDIVDQMEYRLAYSHVEGRGVCCDCMGGLE